MKEPKTVRRNGSSDAAKRRPTVSLVDPDASTHEAVRQLVDLMSLRCEVFTSGEDFLRSDVLLRPGCALLEVRVPQINGLQIQQQLSDAGSCLPVIFLTTQASLSLAVRAMRAGAIHFLEKPFREDELWEAIQNAIEADAQRRRQVASARRRQEQLSSLTADEREVLRMLGQGQSKRAIARELDVCVRTVELRRSQAMKKLGITSTLELLRWVLMTGEENGHHRERLEPAYTW